MASGVFGGALPISPPAPCVLLFQLLVGSAVVGFSQPQSLSRLAALPVVSTCVYSIVTNASEQMRVRWASLLGGTSFAFFLQYVDLALLSRWSYGTHSKGRKSGAGITQTTAKVASKSSDGPSSATGQVSTSTSSHTDTATSESFWDRLSFGWNSMWAFRHVNTEYEVRNVPPFSKQDPTFVPSRWTFVTQRTLVATACYLALDLLSSRPAPTNNAEIFNASLVPFFSRLDEVTSAQLKLRALSIGGFAFTFYCVIQGFQSAAAALTVGLRLSDVKSWRPAFGSLSEAYSLKNVWGKFWHQSLRQLITSPASKLSRNVLRLPRGSLAEKFTTLFLSFAVSGVMHSAAGVASGMSVTELGVFRFFCTQAFGILIEEGAQALFKRLSGKEKTSTPPTALARCLGYAWVVAFLTWSGPIWIYPQAARPNPEGPSSFLPFSVVKALKSQT